MEIENAKTLKVKYSSFQKQARYILETSVQLNQFQFLTKFFKELQGAPASIKTKEERKRGGSRKEGIIKSSYFGF